MHKRAWIVAVSASLLAACTTMHLPGGPETRARPKVKSPTVWVIDNRHISVDQDPLVFRRTKDDEKNVEIVWTLDETESNGTWRFEESSTVKGIVIDRPAGEIIECRLQGESGKRYRCRNLNQVDARYKYTINLIDAGGNRVSLDPIIIND